MRVSVKGKNDKVAKTEIRYAAKYYMNILLKGKEDLLDKLDITVEFIRMDTKGNCSPHDETDGELPTEFIIELDPRASRDNQLSTLAHECVHIKQFALGELDYGDKFIIYKKKKFNLDTVDYWDLPSEIEAYGREVGLLHRYLDHKKENRLKFLSPNDKKKLDVSKRSIYST